MRNYAKCSLMSFINSICDTELYMLFTREISVDNLPMQRLIDIYNEVFSGPSTSSGTMENTTTLCTTATGPRDAVDAPDRAVSNSNVETVADIDIIERCLAPQLGPSTIGSIFSSISTQRDGKLVQLKYPEKNGFAQVEVSIGQYSKVQLFESSEQWKAFDYRTKIATTGPLDPIYSQAMKLIRMICERVKDRDDARKTTFYPRQGISETEEHSDDPINDLSTTATRSAHKRARSDRSTSTGKERLLDFLKQTIFSPPKSLFSSRLWLKSTYRYHDRRKTYFMIVLEQLKLYYSEKCYSEIWIHVLQCDPMKVFFAAEDKHSYYYDIYHSVKYLEALLNWQYDDDSDEVKKFLQNLYDILDKKRPKCNTLFILSKPNSGKNFFFDAVVNSCINFGVIHNWNRYNQFPLQDCTNRRVLFWNEPNFEDGVEETLKMLFGGDQCQARIKYEGDAWIPRTPVIVLSNRDCFPKNLAFRTRMIKHEWHTCAPLANLDRKPHPLGIPYLLARWEII